jgi:tetratricopeptide (TPR) repeat protein
MRFDTRASIGMRRQLLESRRRIWGQSGHPVVATTCNTLASSLVAAGGLDNLYEAITLSDEALQIQEAYFGREGVRALNCLGVSSHARVELAEVLERQGRLAEAETMRLEALQLAEENARVRARRFPNRDNWVSRHRYGVALEMTGDDAGVALLREVLAERLAATDEERRAPTTEASWNADDLARALRRRGHDDEAAEALARVADRRSRFPDLDSAE